MKTIPLSRGLFATVDASDYDAISAYKWYALRCGSVFRPATRLKNRKVVLLYRLLLSAPPGIDVDHINRDPLDNRRGNLRFASHGQNMKNRAGAHKNSKSGVRGVHWDSEESRWRASIQINGKKIQLGAFQTIEGAAKCYAEANRKHFGEFGGGSMTFDHPLTTRRSFSCRALPLSYTVSRR